MVVGTAVVLVGTVVGAIVEAGTVVVVVVVPRPCGNWSVPAGGGVSVTPVSEYTVGNCPVYWGSEARTDAIYVCQSWAGIVPP